MKEKEFDEKLKLAVVRVMRMDSIDGWADRKIPTICAALRAGIILNNEEALMESYVMLSDLCSPIKPTN